MSTRIQRETKVKLSLTITPTEKEQLFLICEEKNISASALLGEWIAKEIKKMNAKKEKKIQSEMSQQ